MFPRPRFALGLPNPGNDYGFDNEVKSIIELDTFSGLKLDFSTMVCNEQSKSVSIDAALNLGTEEGDSLFCQSMMTLALVCSCLAQFLIFINLWFVS